MSIEPPDPAKAWRYSQSYNRPKKLPAKSNPIPKPKRKPRKKKVTFYKLPAELRNKIYELALVSDTKLPAINSKNSQDPALLRTSRQIRSEARGIYYCLNEFSLSVTVNRLEDLRQWLEYIKQTCGKLTGTLCVKRCRAKDVGMLLPLALIVFEGMEVRKVMSDFASLEMLGILRSVASLGEKARKEKLGARKLEEMFDEWMLDLLKHWSSVRGAMPKRRQMACRVWRKTIVIDIGDENDERKKGVEEFGAGDVLEESSPSPGRRSEDRAPDCVNGRRHSSGWTAVN